MVNDLYEEEIGVVIAQRNELTPQKREPAQTAREMYQRGYAKAKDDLKREPLSDEEINAIDLPEKQCTLRELVRIIEKAHGIGVNDE